MTKQQEYIPVAIYSSSNDVCCRAEPLLKANDEEEGYAAASAAAQGRKYCCCFDMRRAVILINLIDCVFVNFFVAAFRCSGEEESKGGESDLSDDCTRPISVSFACAIALKILLNGLGVYGASAFKIWPVALCLGGHICTSLFLEAATLVPKMILSFVISMVADIHHPNIMFFAMILPSIIMFFIFVAYPHLRFMHEVRTGVMSEKTYPRERSGLLTLCC